MNKYIMGVDCGFVAMGVVILQNGKIVDACSVMTEPEKKKRKIRKSDDDAARCEKLATGLNRIIQIYHPCVMFVELPSAGAKSARAAHSMGMSKGIIASVATLLNVPTSYYLPHDSKEATCGAKDASKEAVEAVVRKQFPDTKWPETKGEAEHCFDAAAVLIAAQSDPLYKMAIAND